MGALNDGVRSLSEIGGDLVKSLMELSDTDIVAVKLYASVEDGRPYFSVVAYDDDDRPRVSFTRTEVGGDDS